MMGYSFRLAARVLLYASSHRQDNTYHGLCYTSRGEVSRDILDVYEISIHSVKDVVSFAKKRGKEAC